MKLKKKRGFTLVELIVVVTILAILGTIGFISYNGYLVGVRDSNRVTQLDQIASGLELYRSKNTLPLPGSNMRIESSGTLLGYQGYASQDILDLIDYSKGGRDPKDNVFYTYYISGDKKYYQLLGFLEDQTNQTSTFLGIDQAHAADYTNRYYTTSGKRLGVFVDSFNTPIQESTNVTGSGEFEIYNQTNTFTMIFSDKNIIAGNGTVLRNYSNISNCRRIKESGANKGDGVYLVSPAGIKSFNVYCNMTYDGGGWTLAGRSVLNQTVTPFGWASDYGSVTDDMRPYSLAVTSLSSGTGVIFNDIMIGNYVSGKDLGDKIFKVSIPSANYSLSGASSGAIPVTVGSVVGLGRQCTGPNGRNGVIPTEITHIGYTTRNNGFFIGTGAIATYGLLSNGFSLSASANSCYNGLLNNTGATYTQGELFVR